MTVPKMEIPWALPVFQFELDVFCLIFLKQKIKWKRLPIIIHNYHNDDDNNNNNNLTISNLMIIKGRKPVNNNWTATTTTKSICLKAYYVNCWMICRRQLVSNDEWYENVWKNSLIENILTLSPGHTNTIRDTLAVVSKSIFIVRY